MQNPPSDTMSRNDGAACPICLNSLHPNETTVYLLGCTHLFHCTCIRQWASARLSCPLCRADISGFVDTSTGAITYISPCGQCGSVHIGDRSRCVLCRGAVCPECSVACAICEELLCSECTAECYECGAVFCRTALDSCECGCELCPDHAIECVQCRECTCRACEYQCEDCHFSFCTACVGACEGCSEQFCTTCSELLPTDDVMCPSCANGP